MKKHSDLLPAAYTVVGEEQGNQEPKPKRKWQTKVITKKTTKSWRWFVDQLVTDIWIGKTKTRCGEDNYSWKRVSIVSHVGMAIPFQAHQWISIRTLQVSVA